MPKNSCPICKKTANVCPSNKDGSVQCSVCDLWYHPTCADMSRDMYDYINKGKELHGLTSVWTCQVCTTAWAKIQKSVKEVSKIAADNDRRITALEKSKTDEEDKAKKNNSMNLNLGSSRCFCPAKTTRQAQKQLNEPKYLCSI